MRVQTYVAGQAKKKTLYQQGFWEDECPIWLTGCRSSLRIFFHLAYADIEKNKILLIIS